MSANHQFIEHSDKVIARYTKTIQGILTGFRLDPSRPENRMDWVLQSPETSFVFVADPETGKVTLIRKEFDYEQEVLEIYSENELKLFQRLNRHNIENGVLVTYENTSPGVDLSNVLSDSEVAEIAATKQVLSLRKRLQAFTSAYTLQRIQKAAEELDRPHSIMKVIQERINDVSANNNR